MPDLLKALEELEKMMPQLKKAAKDSYGGDEEMDMEEDMFGEEDDMMEGMDEEEDMPEDMDLDMMMMEEEDEEEMPAPRGPKKGY